MVASEQLTAVSIYFENGLFLEAKSFGAEGTQSGEIVFNTSMSGYQEIVSDPSYAGQFVTFTMPEIGIVGCNDEDMESSAAYAKGIFVRNYHDEPSNFRSTKRLGALLKEFAVMGICEIDTRMITRMLRKEGTMMMIASTEIHDESKLKQMLDASPRIEEIDYIKDVSTLAEYEHSTGVYDMPSVTYSTPPQGEHRVAVLDFGVKRNILNNLVSAGLHVSVLPYNYDMASLLKRIESGEFSALFFSNGPGDPLILSEIHQTIRELMQTKIPTFAICLGHQLLSIAHGYKTYKLPFGHHGGNHPVQSVNGQLVEITAQNHNYNVPKTITEIADVTHINLFDQTIEGVRYHDAPIISVQHHPESSPGPHESSYIFKEFVQLIDAHS